MKVLVKESHIRNYRTAQNSQEFTALRYEILRIAPKQNGWSRFLRYYSGRKN